MIKRKGQMVPRWLVKANEKKSQHLIKFGCDVEIINKKVYAIGEGSVFIVPPDKYCNLKKNKGKTKRTVKGFDFKNSYVDMSRQEKPGAMVHVDVIQPKIKIPFEPDFMLA